MKPTSSRSAAALRRRALPRQILCLSAALAANLVWAVADYSSPYSFTTVAGISSIGSDDGPARLARFFSPHGVAADSAGNLFVADKGNHTIRRFAPDGTVSTVAGKAGVAGSADGRGPDARFDQPFAVAVDASGNLFVADTVNSTIRKITPDGNVSTLAGAAQQPGRTDGSGRDARFCIPSGVAVDGAGNVFVADSGNNTIRRITPDGTVTTLAGTAGVFGAADGTGPTAQFFYPLSVAVDAAGVLYVAEAGNYAVRRISPAGEVTTLIQSQSLMPQGVAVDGDGNVFVSGGRDVIARIAPNGDRTIVAGTDLGAGSADGAGSEARFRSPLGLAVDDAGNLFVADRDNNTIRKITPAAIVTTVAGLGLDASVGTSDGLAKAARFDLLAGAAVGPAGEVYVADSLNATVRKFTPDGAVVTLAGAAGQTGSADGVGSAARFDRPLGIAVNPAGTVYVSDAANDTIRMITPAGVVTTFAGDADGPPGSADATGAAARFSYPAGLAIDATGNLYVADSANSTIRRITPDGVVTTVAGCAGANGLVDGAATAARFTQPRALAIDAAGNLFVGDQSNFGAIRKISPGGIVTTLAGGHPDEEAGHAGDGPGVAAHFNYPQGLADDAGGNVYVADSNNHTVRQITPAGVVSTLAGLADAAGSADSVGSDSRFLYPQAAAVDAAGNLYVTSGSTIRRGRLAGPPVINRQPQSLSVAAGMTAVLSITASGSPDPTYLWYFNGSPLSGANANSVTLAGVRSSDSGRYTVAVSNALGSVTSEPATLTVTVAPAASPDTAAGTGGGGAFAPLFVLGVLVLGTARACLPRADAQPATSTRNDDLNARNALATE